MAHDSWFHKHPVLTGILLFISVVFLIIMFSSPEQETQYTPESEESQPKIEETQPTEQVSDVGDFIVVYSPVTNQDYLEYEKIFKEAELFENKAQYLNNLLILPHDVTITLAECGIENAFYDPHTKQIIMCYELMNHFAQIFSDYSEDDTDLGMAMLNSLDFVFYHELGHALIDIYKLPTTGNPEDNADQASTLVLLTAGDPGIDTLLDGANWFYITSENTDIEESTFSDIHSPDKRRYYNLVCLIYGSDPQNGEYLITEWGLPEERALVCEDEYSQAFYAWNNLLSPYFKN